MSEFQVRVVQIGAIERHPNADNLSITRIGGEGGYPVILRTGEFREGDKAVYVPVTAVVPADDPRWSFLLPKGTDANPTWIEIEAKKLRGVFSMGILTPADPSWEVGRDVASELRITRAEAPEPTEGNERDPGLMPVYTDLPALRAYPHVLAEGEEVVITEKIHGESARYTYGYGRLYCGSRTCWKDPASTVQQSQHWWEVGRRLGLEERLRSVEGFGIYGEVYGDERGVKYDATSDRRGFRLFDAIDCKRRAYVDFDTFLALAARLELPVVPILYRGPWKTSLRELAEGKSTFADHVREGIVIRPAKERFDPAIGRVILKLHGEGFLLRGKKSR